MIQQNILALAVNRWIKLFLCCTRLDMAMRILLTRDNMTTGHSESYSGQYSVGRPDMWTLIMATGQESM